MIDLPPETTISVAPSAVEFRQRTGFGVRVVRVMIDLHEPRILAQVEVARNGIEIMPMSLSLSEINNYVQHALYRVGLLPRTT